MAAQARRPFNRTPVVHTTTLDPKGRVILPKPVREQLGPDFVMMIGDMHQIECFSVEDWNKRIDQLESAGEPESGALDLMRETFSTAHYENNCDPQGRVVIPRELRILAEINDEVRIRAFGNNVEIWSLACDAKRSLVVDGYLAERRAGLQSARRRMAEGI